MLRDNIRQQLTFQFLDHVLEKQLALFEALQLQEIDRLMAEQPVDDLIEIEVLARRQGDFLRHTELLPRRLR